MNKEALMEYLRTPKGKLTAAVSVLVLVWAVILVSSLDGLDTLFPDDARVAESNRELRRQKLQYEKAVAQQKELDKLLADYNAVIERAWKEDVNGVVDTELRRLVSEAARGIEMKLDSIGAVKSNRINQDFYFAELDISVRSSFGEVVKLIDAISKIRPQLAWRRLDIRPDHRPPHMISGANAQGNSITARVLNDGNNGKVTSRVVFSGTLRIVGFDGKQPAGKAKTAGGAK